MNGEGQIVYDSITASVYTTPGIAAPFLDLQEITGLTGYRLFVSTTEILVRDPDGNIVPFGLTGPHGPTGVQGPRGYPGIGIPGPTGTNGTNGYDGNPAGTIIPFAGSIAPDGYLVCDGSAVSRTVYTTLFTVIGTTYGSGDGSTTFNVPNIKGRVVTGYDAAQSEFQTVGLTGGEKTHTLTEAEMPTHTHPVIDPGHVHELDQNKGDASYIFVNGSYVMKSEIGLSGGTGSASNIVTMSATTGITIGTAGSGTAHNNLQPYIVMNYYIKYDTNVSILVVPGATSIASFVGPTGPAGPIGPTGYTGPTGYFGIVGVNYGDYPYWDTSINDWVVSHTNIRLGANAGIANSENAIAIGYDAGTLHQDKNAIAIGYGAGSSNQGENAIAIGNRAGNNSQASDSIVLNASSISLNAANSGFYVHPVRSIDTPDIETKVVGYNYVTNECIQITKINLESLSTATCSTGVGIIGNLHVSTIVLGQSTLTAGPENKTFVIDHPYNPEKYLVHACLEGPEAGVYYRGTSCIPNNCSSVVVSLPDYAMSFREFTIQITPIWNGNIRTLNASNIVSGTFIVYGEPGEFNWLVHGVRSDIQVEPNRSDVTLFGNGPYKWIVQY